MSNRKRGLVKVIIEGEVEDFKTINYSLIPGLGVNFR